jgi:hypothetical protein
VANRSSPPPNPWRDCQCCGFRHYPKAVPVTPGSIIVEWTIPERCESCGATLPREVKTAA